MLLGPCKNKKTIFLRRLLRNPCFCWVRFLRAYVLQRIRNERLMNKHCLVLLGRSYYTAHYALEQGLQVLMLNMTCKEDYALLKRLFTDAEIDKHLTQMAVGCCKCALYTTRTKLNDCLREAKP